MSNPIRQILTHPGGAHKDEFLACCVLIHTHRVPVVRREPVPEDLEDSGTVVVDVGGVHDPEKSNFDHHQFPRDAEPVCALSLVLMNLGLYQDARQFCDWLETAEWMDCRGPVETAAKLGMDRRAMDQLLSPIDVTLLRRFAMVREMGPENPLWQVMAMVGEDLVTYVTSLRERMAFIKEHAEVWSLGGGAEALFMPRTEPMPEEPSAGLPRFVGAQGKDESVVALVYPDRRGTGYGLSRHRDSPSMDFTRIADEPDVHFAHARGFVAKSSATDRERLMALLKKARVSS